VFETIIDHDRIINPLDGANPCGVNIREGDDLTLGRYKELKSIRSSLRKEERIRAETGSALTSNNKEWGEVLSLANEILTKYSKDIEVAVWLLEGLTRVEGIRGLGDGLHIIYSLIKNYDLSMLYPKAAEGYDSEEADDLLLPILMLNGRYEAGTIIAPIYFCPLIYTLSGESYSGWEIKKILEENNSTKSHQEVTQKMILESKVIKDIIADIDTEKFLQIQQNLLAAVENFKNLNLLLTEKFESNAPNLSNIDSVLKYCHNLVANLCKVVKSDEKKSTPTNAPELNEKVYVGASLDLQNIDSISINKQEAVKLLEILIKFFKENESHSPISYLLSRALNWSISPLPEILCDLIPDDKRREEYCRFSGVPFIRKGNN
jgi:type VI secretion system protein ImpA